MRAPLARQQRGLRRAAARLQRSALPCRRPAERRTPRGRRLQPQINSKGTYDFEEEHACEVLLKSNCYCYAVDRFVGSYCEPGLGGTGQPFKLPSEAPCPGGARWLLA
jgi:hypothetical protein